MKEEVTHNMKTMDIGFSVSDVEANIAKMESELIYLLEIDVCNGVFAENGKTVLIANKSINYPKLDRETLSRDKFSMNYDPFMSVKIALWMFTRYAVIRQTENVNFNIYSFFTSKTLSHPDYLFCTCRTNRGDITGKAFINESVAWINLIYTMEYGDTNYPLFKQIDDYITMRSLMEMEMRETNAKHISNRRF